MSLMPELPEVQTVVNHLSEHLPGRRVTAVNVSWHRSVAVPSHRLFVQQISGCRFDSVARRGKYIVVSLTSGLHLLAHLRMSGDLIVRDAAEPHSKHERVCIDLDNGQQLRFVDTRKFGRLYLVKHREDVLKDLGPEPLAEEFCAQLLLDRVKERRSPIKVLLLDQTVVAGLGNIYVAESLWRAGIHPLARVQRLSTERVRKLCESIREVISEALKASGTDLGDGVWKKGAYVPKAYGQAGTPCVRCGRTMRHMVVAQRSTDYCPQCQRR